MTKKLSFYYTIVFLFLCIGQSLLSQTSLDNYIGFWENPESWNPRWNTPITNKINSNITIKGFIKTANDLVFTKGNLTVLDTLVIDGNLQLGEKTKITLGKNSILIVLGSVIVKGEEGKITMGESAYFVVGGKFMLQSDGELKEFSSKDNPPKIFIADKIQPSDITDDDSDYASLDCKKPKYPYLHSKCTFGNFDDFKTDPLYPFYETLINGDPPTITFQPLDVTVCNGTNIEFTVVADDAENYQWQVNDGDSFVNLTDDSYHEGSNSNRLRIQNVTTAKDSYLYRCKVSNVNDVSALSAPAVLTVAAAVSANAGSDANICQNSSHMINGTTVTNGNGNYLWTHNGGGSISGSTTLTPTYTPNASDAGKTITLTLSVQGNADCAQATSQMQINVAAAATANAGSDTSICQNSSYKVIGASVSNSNSSYLWTHNGGGSISDSTTLTPTYTPTASDAGKTVVFTFTAQGNADCAQATAQMQIKVAAGVTSNAGSDANVCENSSHPITGASVSNGNGLYLWTHNGSGSITDATTLTPTYTPTATDAGKTIVLILTAQGIGGCSTDKDQVSITVDKQINGTVGADDAICGTSYILSGSGDGSTGRWSQANGPGEVKFLPRNNMENPKVEVSEPGVYIFKWTLSNGQCMDESSVKIHFREVPNAKINAESNVCGLEQVISATPENVSGFWQIVSGPEGASLGVNIERITNKIKVKEIGTYSLTWIANLNGCIDTAYHIINFNKVPIVNPGVDKKLFYNREAVLDASLQNKETGNWEIQKGFGFFGDKHSPTTKVTNLAVGENIFEWVVTNGLCESKSSVLITVSDAQIPNIITPNGDAMNDNFIVKDIESLGPIHIVIFNRWGNKVYESKNYKNEWNGRDSNGNELMNDTYYYYLEFANKNAIKGYVLIQR